MFVGIVDLASTQWTAGGAYSAMLARSLRLAGGAGLRIGWLSAQGALPAWGESLGLELLRLPPPGFRGFLPIEAKVRTRLGLPVDASQATIPERVIRRLAQRVMHRPGVVEPVAEAAGVDVLLPLLELGERRPTHLRRLGWIPDFQHVHLPRFFTSEEISIRDILHRAVTERSDVVLVSSEASRRDLESHVPVTPRQVLVSSFPSLFAFNPPSAEPGIVRARYGIPEHYALVANQFWAHKNHGVLVDALRILKQRRVRVPLVMTGMPSDHRDPQNGVLSRLLQQIASAGIREDVWLLGMVTTQELQGLLRGAAAVIQPSMFEGWSTTVQDARALGRPVVCSDLAVHHEQAPDAAGYFSPTNAEQLAHVIEHFDDMAPGPDLAAEAACLERERVFARRHGDALLQAMRGPGVPR